MAAAMGTDPVTAAKQLGQALDGQIVQIGRFNIAATSVADLAPKLRAAVGGQAEEVQKARGAFGQVAVALDKFQEAVGKVARTGLDAFLQRVVSVLERMVSFYERLSEMPAWNEFVEKVGSALGLLVAYLAKAFALTSAMATLPLLPGGALAAVVDAWHASWSKPSNSTAPPGAEDSDKLTRSKVKREQDLIALQIQEQELMGRARRMDNLSPSMERWSNAVSQLASLGRELDLLNERRDLNQRAYDSNLITEAEFFKEELEIKKQILEIEERTAQARDARDSETFAGRMRLNARELQSQWGNMAVNMANAITTHVTSAMQGLSQAMANVIMGTQSAAQAFGQFALQMATSFIASVIEMILMAKVAIPILTALGVLSGGSTAATGSAVTISSMGIAMSAVAGMTARASGGLIPGPYSDSDNRLAMVASGEYVARSRAVRYYGPAVFEALNAMSIPRSALSGYGLSASASGGSAFAGGGLVGNGPAGGDIHVVYFDDRQRLKRYLEGSQGRKILYNVTSGQRTDLGIG
jgi:hypothetical protein